MVKSRMIRVGDDYIKLCDFMRKNTGLPKRALSDRALSNIVSNFVFEEKLHPYLLRRIEKGKRRGFL